MEFTQNLFDPATPELTLEQVREFVHRAQWREAKSDPGPIRHRYMMLHMAAQQDLRSGYWTMVRMIQRFGVDRCWRRRVFRSIDLDGTSYWLQDLPVARKYALDIVNAKSIEAANWNKHQPLMPDWAQPV